MFPAVLNALRQKTGQISLCKWPTATARFLSRTLKRNSAHSGETSLRWKRKRRRSGLTEQLGSSCRRDWAPRARNLHGPAVLVRRERLQVGRGAKDVEHATSQKIDTSTSMANEPFAMCREPTRWVKLRPSGPIRDEVHTAGRPIRLLARRGTLHFRRSPRHKCTIGSRRYHSAAPFSKVQKSASCAEVIV